MVATIGRAAAINFGGLEQFPIRGSFGGLGYCVGEAAPYALEFSNDDDVICLLLGDIVSKTRFDADPERQVVFRGETAAYHPRHGNVRVDASKVTYGFIAFAYPREFQDAVCDISLDKTRLDGSINNISLNSIRYLARYARELLTKRGQLQPLEIQYLGGMVYLETLNGLRAARASKHAGIPDSIFRRISEFVDANLDGEISCERLAHVADLPLRRVFDGIRERTGLSPYQWVIERRVERARSLLSSSDLSISEIALVCGFASQQHMTTTVSRRLGSTPQRLRHS
jgi:AraC family transcriptional regulator